MLDSIYKPCEEWLEKLSMPKDDLSPADQATLEAHLAKCPACSLAWTDFNMVGRLLRALPAPEFSLELPPALLQLWEEEDLFVQEATSQNAQALSELLPQLQVMTTEEGSTIDHLLAGSPELSDLIPLGTIEPVYIASPTHVIPTENQHRSSDILPQDECPKSEKVSVSDRQYADEQTSEELVLLALLIEHSEKDGIHLIKWIKDKGLRNVIEHLAFMWIRDIRVRLLKWLKPVRFFPRETLHCSEKGCYFLLTANEQGTSTIRSFSGSLIRSQTIDVTYHVIQLIYDSSGRITSKYEGKELKAANSIQCEKCSQLVNVPVEFEKGSAIFCNHFCDTEQANCITNGLNVNLKDLLHVRLPNGGTGTMLICPDGNLRFSNTLDSVCANDIAQMFEKAQQLNMCSISERKEREEYLYSQNKSCS